MILKALILVCFSEIIRGSDFSHLVLGAIIRLKSYPLLNATGKCLWGICILFIRKGLFKDILLQIHPKGVCCNGC